MRAKALGMAAILAGAVAAGYGAVAIPKRTKAKRPIEAGAPVIPPGQVEGHTQSLHGMRWCRAEPARGGIAVAAQAEIWDYGPDVPPYVWSVAIRDLATREIVFDETDDARPVRVPAGELGTPTFQARYALPPGRYRVRVELRAAADRTLPDGALERAGSLVTGVEDVTVPSR